MDALGPRGVTCSDCKTSIGTRVSLSVSAFGGCSSTSSRWACNTSTGWDARQTSSRLPTDPYAVRSISWMGLVARP
eukprot:5714357-Prymnesium_polylepis.1